MRRTDYAMSPANARALLADARYVHLASTTVDGAPLLRTVHTVLVGDALCFHGARVGEKHDVLPGRPAVAQVADVVATVPSTFFDPVRACPATTYYRSAQATGTIGLVEEPATKARVLQALMEKLQPQGGHAPITADDPRYAGAVRGIAIFALSLDDVQGKAKLAQNRPPDTRAALLQALWRRGDDDDPRAIELIRAANADDAPPAFLDSGVPGTTLRAWLPSSRALEAARLCAPGYWNAGFDEETLARAHRASPAWVGAVDDRGALVATARAISDGSKRAWIYDVMVAPAWRGRGLGRAVTALLLDHPRVRRVAHVHLATRDAMGLYEKLGFVDDRARPPRPYPTTTMTRVGRAQTAPRV